MELRCLEWTAHEDAEVDIELIADASDFSVRQRGRGHAPQHGAVLCSHAAGAMPTAALDVVTTDRRQIVRDEGTATERAWRAARSIGRHAARGGGTARGRARPGAGRAECRGDQALRHDADVRGGRGRRDGRARRRALVSTTPRPTMFRWSIGARTGTSGSSSRSSSLAPVTRTRARALPQPGGMSAAAAASPRRSR